jgi:glutamate synthase domain-containing protein 3
VVTVEFCCDNGCEYIIGGNVVIFGEEGNNFSII